MPWLFQVLPRGHQPARIFLTPPRKAKLFKDPYSTLGCGGSVVVSSVQGLRYLSGCYPPGAMSGSEGAWFFQVPLWGATKLLSIIVSMVSSISYYLICCLFNYLLSYLLSVQLSIILSTVCSIIDYLIGSIIRYIIYSSIYRRLCYRRSILQLDSYLPIPLYYILSLRPCTRIERQRREGGVGKGSGGSGSAGHKNGESIAGVHSSGAVAEGQGLINSNVPLCSAPSYCLPTIISLSPYPSIL